MEGSNRVEPLNKDENELKRGPLSVGVGAQHNKQIGLRFEAKMSSKEGEVYLPLKIKTLVALCLMKVASKLLKNPSLLLEWSW